MSYSAVVSPVRTRRLRLPAMTAVGASMLSLLVLYGWRIKSIFLISVVPGFAPMVPNTAVGMMLLGLALGCAERRGRTATVVADLSILATLAISGATLLEYAGMKNIGMSRWL